MKKIKILLFAFLFTGTIWSQDINTFALNADHFAFSVKDVNRSVEFYITVLRLQEVTNRTKKEGIRWISLGDGKELHLISTIKGDITTTKAVHIAFKSTMFEAFIENLKNRNITYSDWEGTLNKISIRADGIKQIYFQDPDGYWIEVNSI